MGNATTFEGVGVDEEVVVDVAVIEEAEEVLGLAPIELVVARGGD